MDRPTHTPGEINLQLQVSEDKHSADKDLTELQLKYKYIFEGLYLINTEVGQEDAVIAKLTEKFGDRVEYVERVAARYLA